MIPYFPQPVVALGGWHIHAFSVTMASAIVVGRGIVLRRARRFAIGQQAIVLLYLCVLLAGLAGACTGILMQPESQLSSIGGAVAGLAAGIFFCGWRGYSAMETLRMLDVLAFAGTFAAALGRLGCALAHDHPGALSTSLLAVRFPDGPRYDLGLVDLLFLAGLCAVFCWLDRRPRPAGFFLIAGMIAYSAFRVLRSELEVEPHVLGWMLVCLAGGAAGIVAAHCRGSEWARITPPACRRRPPAPRHRWEPGPAEAPETPPSPG